MINFHLKKPTALFKTVSEDKHLKLRSFKDNFIYFKYLIDSELQSQQVPLLTELFCLYAGPD